MSRFRLHLRVYDLETNVRFYSTLFGVNPSVRQPSYAQWDLEDPRLSFAISVTGSAPGLESVGIDADSDGELEEVRTRFEATDAHILDEEPFLNNASPSDLYWLIDPQGILWRASRSVPQSQCGTPPPALYARETGGATSPA